MDALAINNSNIIEKLSLIEVAEPNNGLQLLHILQCLSLLDSSDFYWIHPQLPPPSLTPSYSTHLAWKVHFSGLT